MGAGAPTRDTNRPRQRRIVNENFSANPCDVEMMTFGDKGDRVIIQFFNEFTSRSAGGGGGGKKKKDGADDKKTRKDASSIQCPLGKSYRRSSRRKATECRRQAYLYAG